MAFKAYPLQFTPIIKERIWGGTKLKSVLNKDIASEISGESWELSTVPGDISTIANGEFAGRSLTDVIDNFPEQLLGTSVYKRFGKQFPLLFKFIDAREDLSIQVHPNDELAKQRHNSFGKTEMWYIMQADEGSELIVGFKQGASAEKYLENLKNKTLLDILEHFPVQQGDVFFLETGTVHAIGAGVLLAEIQQTSDITYRIYDFDRLDANGNSRELHIEQALDAINYDEVDAQKVYDTEVNQSNLVVDCPYFTTNFIPLNGSAAIKKSDESFTVYMCVDGNFSITYTGEVFNYKKGDTVLIPGEMTDYTIGGNASLLEIYIL